MEIPLDQTVPTLLKAQVILCTLVALYVVFFVLAFLSPVSLAL